MKRRGFLITMAATPFAASAPAPGLPPVCIFSKHMSQFAPAELGRRAKDIGFDGIDLTVRAKGHVLPDRAVEDMPKAVDEIRSHGLTVPMITTDIKTAKDPAANKVLASAGKLGISYWKPGYESYGTEDVEVAVKRVRGVVKGLAALSATHGIVAGLHNHSGSYFGAAVWDTRAVIHDLDPKWIGYYFDPGHATIEGGLAGWRIAQNMATPRLKMVALKDFYWEKMPDGKWKHRWCPIGEGMVDWDRVFASFAAAKFTGPMSLHLEYEAKDEQQAMARDLAFVKKRIAAAYGSA